jgi:hypothetical protein
VNILLIRRTGDHNIVHLRTGRVVETSLDSLKDDFVASTLRGESFGVVIFDGCSWADIHGETYHLLSAIVPTSAGAVVVRSPSRVGGVL